MSQFTYTVPIQRMQAFAGLAARRGWDVDSLMRSAGVSPLLLTQDRSRVTTQQASSLVWQLLRTTGDELFGLSVAAVPPGTVRMLGFALLGAADLGQALQRFQSFKHALPGIPPVLVGTDADDKVTTVSIDLSGIPDPLDLLVDTSLAAMHRTMGWATKGRIPLQRIEIPHPHPPNVDDYDIVFGAPIVFCAARPALVFPSNVLAAPIMRSDLELDQFLRNAPAQIMSRRDYAVSLTDRVRRMIERGLSSRWPTPDDIADRLAMSPQTLRRKLGDENTSLSRIREDILRDAAITSLASTQESIAALSTRLGFSEPSAFTRAFRRWTGCAPGTYRLDPERRQSARR